MEGGKVCVSSRKKQNVDAAVERLRQESKCDVNNVTGVVAHVATSADRSALIEHTVKSFSGKIDVLVLNAAISPALPSLMDSDSNAFTKVMDVNVSANIELVKAAVAFMPKGSAICFISSIGGFHPSAPHPLYGISKTALFGVTKAFATELSGDEIRVNCVAPGMIKTSFSKPIWADKTIEEGVAARTLLGRLGEATEIAGCVAFLCSSDASYVTGEVLVAAGGMVPSRL